MARAIWVIGSVVVAAVAAIWVVNAPRFAPQADGPPTILAHRGVHQLYDRTALGRDECTATRMFPPEHRFLENTIPSTAAAFAAGADVVEIDIHPTTDGDFIVFHDWTLECRTNGQGRTRDHTVAELKALDVGHGYTADGGATYPFRGDGVGLMPTLDEMLDAFPGRRFLINVKSNDPREGEQLAAFLIARGAETRARVDVYGGPRPVAVVAEALPDLKTLTKPRLKACLQSYMLTGWFGRVPASCNNLIVVAPSDVAPFLWGWPHRFVARMRSAGTDVYVSGPLNPDGAEGGINAFAADDLRAVPDGFAGGVWTDTVEVIGPALKTPAVPG